MWNWNMRSWWLQSYRTIRFMFFFYFSLDYCDKVVVVFSILLFVFIRFYIYLHTFWFCKLSEILLTFKAANNRFPELIVYIFWSVLVCFFKLVLPTLLFKEFSFDYCNKIKSGGKNGGLYIFSFVSISIHFSFWRFLICLF